MLPWHITPLIPPLLQEQIFRTIPKRIVWDIEIRSAIYQPRIQPCATIKINLMASLIYIFIVTHLSLSLSHFIFYFIFFVVFNLLDMVQIQFQMFYLLLLLLLQNNTSYVFLYLIHEPCSYKS